MDNILIQIATVIGTLLFVLTAIQRMTPNANTSKNATLNKLLKVLGWIAASYSKGNPKFWKTPFTPENTEMKNKDEENGK